MGKSKAWSQQLAESHGPISRDFDPEEDGPVQDSDEENGSEKSEEDDLAGTEHYVEVSKSKLRTREEVALGPEYAGSRISREALLNGKPDSDVSTSDSGAEEDSDGESGASRQFADPENVNMNVDEEDGDIDSDAAFGDSDLEKFKDFTFRGSSNTANGVNRRPTAADFMSDSENEDIIKGTRSSDEEMDEDVLGSDRKLVVDAKKGSHEEEEDDDESHQGSALSDDEETVDEDNEDGSEEESEEGDDEKATRAELRDIMNEEQKTVVATISHAAKVDADKGSAVKQQRKAFDSLLSIRMVLQKSLISTNSMAVIDAKDYEEDLEEPYQAAENAALKLWNTLDGLRHELIRASGSSKTGQKRKRDVDSFTSSSNIWERMQASEVTSIDNRQRILEKWWGKVRGSTAPLTGKLNNVVPMSLNSIIQEQLAKPDTIEKTKRARSCAPVQERLKIIEDPHIYDDTTLYKTLLNQLVEQRKMDSGLSVGAEGAPAQWAVKEAKMRKVVDTKASKGRKMRFTVHEKLQNFMAPEDRGAWEPSAIDRFFGTLLGQKMTLGEEDVEKEQDEVTLEEESLKLFQS